MVSGACEVAALDLETLPRSEAGMVDAEFRLLVSTFGRCIENYHRVWVIFHGAAKMQYGRRIRSLCFGPIMMRQQN